MIRINRTQTELIARLSTNCFINDPLVIMETKGMDLKQYCFIKYKSTSRILRDKK